MFVVQYKQNLFYRESQDVTLQAGFSCWTKKKEKDIIQSFEPTAKHRTFCNQSGQCTDTLPPTNQIKASLLMSLT